MGLRRPTSVVAHPQLEVLRAVVEPIAVLVMDGLVLAERPPKHFLHDEAVLELRLTVGLDLPVSIWRDGAHARFSDPYGEWIAVGPETLKVLDAITMASSKTLAAVHGAALPVRAGNLDAGTPLLLVVLQAVPVAIYRLTASLDDAELARTVPTALVWCAIRISMSTPLVVMATAQAPSKDLTVASIGTALLAGHLGLPQLTHTV